jgi:DNA polymerase-4
MDRQILHCDCNSFFASVETVLNPALARGPMAVCGDPKSRHGIILAKNDAAKRCGVQTAETIWQAQRKCPDLKLVPPHHEAYRAYSKRVNAIYERYTDLVEPFGIDESWLDVTGSSHLFGTPQEIADRLRREVQAETGLTISVGVSFNKVFAKLGSDYKKPNATTVITRADVPTIVWPLPVSALLYVGDSVQKTLASLYIETIGQLAAADRTMLIRKLGRAGEMLHDYANGQDDSPVRPAGESREVKSVGNGITFRRDLVGEADVRAGVTALCDEVAGRLRRYGFCCRTVQLSIKDTCLHTIGRRQTLERPTSLDREMIDACMALYRECWNEQRPIRMLTVTAMNLLPADAETEEQVSLFGTPVADREKQRRLARAVDSLRAKYGHDALTSGTVLASDVVGHEPAEPDEDLSPD